MKVRQILWGVCGGVAGVALCRWGGYYLPLTDSFANLRDLPGIALALFVGPYAALVAGFLSAVGRALIGLYGGMGGATLFASSLATLVATLVAVAARRWVFRGERPSFALGAAVAAVAEMMHMATVLLVGFADFSVAFAVIVAAIPFQCGGTAAVVAAISLMVNRRQNGRENLLVATLAATLVASVLLVYLAMSREAVDFAAGRLPTTKDLYHYPCNLATVLHSIVLSALAFAFAAYAKHHAAGRSRAGAPETVASGRVRIGLRGKMAISLAAMLALIGFVIGTVVSSGMRMQFERGCAEMATDIAKCVSELIDGSHVPGYCETRRKDAYYQEVQRILDAIEKRSGIAYLYVMIPDGKEIIYVWDAGQDSELGEREGLDEHVDQMLKDVMDRKLKDVSFVHRGQRYGNLMTAVVPVSGKDGAPVALVGVDVSMESIDREIGRVIVSVAVVTLVIVLMCLAGYYFFVSRFIVSPAERQIQAEKDRIYAELTVARKIQADALPNVFPAFPDRRDFDIHAMMAPAKEVGGDFYDFFLVDDARLAVVIGDVSDKGVPAALFMMTAKTFVKALVLQGGTPAEVLRDVNDRLCENNRSGMFVTVYLAIINLETGECLSANAGHEHPALRRKGGRFELVRYAHDPMLGVVPGLTYSDRAFRLSPGDTLFVYTDGVPEAKGADGRAYGMDRMTEALDRAGDGPVSGLLDGVRSDVGAFVGDAPQFDDITLLAVTVLGRRTGQGGASKGEPDVR